MTADTARTRESASIDEALRLDRQLCFAVYSASALMTRAYRPLLEPLGLTYPQYLVMLVLWERGRRSVGDLGEALGLDSGTLTPLLKRMEASGLITRRRDSADERRVLIDLTEAGRDLRERAAEVPRALACALPVPAEDAAALRDAIQDFTRRMKAAGA